MIPNASEVVRRRWVFVSVLRLLGVVGVLVALPAAALWIAEGVRDDDLLDITYYWPRMLMSLSGFGAAFVALLGAKRVSRWIVPARTTTSCPRCWYRLEGLVEPICPECGLTLTPEFMGGTREEPAPEPRAVRLVKIRDLMTPWVRLVGLLMVLTYGLYAFVVSVGLLVDAPNDPATLIGLWITVIFAWIVLIGGVGMIIRGEWVSAMLVPRVRGPEEPTEPPPARDG